MTTKLLNGRCIVFIVFIACAVILELVRIENSTFNKNFKTIKRVHAQFIW